MAEVFNQTQRESMGDTFNWVTMEMEAIDMQATARHLRAAYCGNALMEYALPAAIILLSSGLLITLTGATNIMAEYYLSASGRSASSLQGSQFKTYGLAESAYGKTGNGFSAFGGGNFVRLSNGSGATISSIGGAVFYLGEFKRQGARPSSPSADYLYR
jgi:hypothetical protein